MARLITKALLFISFFGIVYGFTAPNYDGYITDTVGVFSQSEKNDLTTKIEEIQKATSIEIAVLVVPTVDDDINLAAVDVGNQWGVGKKDQNNGVLLLIAVDDKKWSIQVGYGLEGTLPDLVTKRIGEARFPPNFREGNYYQGVLEMLDDTLGYIQQDPTLVQTYSQDNSSTDSYNTDYLGFIFIIFFFALSGFGRWITVPSVKGKGRTMKKYGRWIYAIVGLILGLLLTLVISVFILSFFISYLFLLFGVLLALYGKTGPAGAAMRFGGGGGSSWGGGGGGFGGFGGGSFGGGGSSGSR